MKHEVGDWMSRHPIRIALNEDVRNAQEIMRQEGIRHLLVFDTITGKVYGVLSESDLKVAEQIRRRFKDSDCKAVKITVGDLMSRSPLSISMASPMSEAIGIMNDKKVHSLPVLDKGGRCVGILTGSDVMRYALVSAHRVDLDEAALSVLKVHGA